MGGKKKRLQSYSPFHCKGILGEVHLEMELEGRRERWHFAYVEGGRFRHRKRTKEKGQRLSREQKVRRRFTVEVAWA